MSELTQARLAGSSESAAVEGLRWVSHPIRGAHQKTTLLAAVVLATALLIGSVTASVAWGVLSAALLLLGVYDYLFPTTYEISRRGVESRVLLLRRRKPWRVLRSFHVDGNGVLLSPFPGRSRLEAFRGLYLRFNGNRREVLRLIAEHLGAGEDA